MIAKAVFVVTTSSDELLVSWRCRANQQYLGIFQNSERTDMRFEKMRKERKICTLILKRVLAVVLAAALSCSLIACSGKNSGTGEGAGASQAVQEEASAKDGTQAAAERRRQHRNGSGGTGCGDPGGTFYKG